MLPGRPGIGVGFAHAETAVKGYYDISGDGRFAAFGSFANDLVPGDTNHDGKITKDEALRRAEEGLWVFEDGRLDELVSFTAGLLSDAGRREEAEAHLWRAFEKAPSLGLYAQLRQLGGNARLHSRPRIRYMRSRSLTSCSRARAGPCPRSLGRKSGGRHRTQASTIRRSAATPTFTR